MDYMPDYTELHAMHEALLEKRIEKYPKCDCCGERILDDEFFNIEGTYICENCIDDFKVNTDDYVED